MNAPIEQDQILVSLLRASSLTLAFACSGSIRETEIRINESNEAAAAGSAAHKCAESLPRTGKIDFEQIPIVADEYGCDSEELRFLCRQATKLWHKVKDSFPNALTEVAVDHTLEISGLKITGHIDGISISGDVARLWDWKFGRLDSDYYHQMMAYAAMVLLQFPSIREVTATILWARDQEIENYTVTREQAQAWMARVEAEVVNWDGVFRPNEKCQYCPRQHDCPAFNALARSRAAAVLDVDIASVATTLATMPADQVIDLERKAKMMAAVAGKLRDSIHDMVKSGREIIGSEAQLVVSNEPRREIDPIAAWSIVEETGFSQDDWAHCIKISVTKLEKRIAENAGKGNGAAAKRTLNERLQLAGAIEMVDRLIVKERRL